MKSTPRRKQERMEPESIRGTYTGLCGGVLIGVARVEPLGSPAGGRRTQ
jgi:hypothetical protein